MQIPRTNVTKPLSYPPAARTISGGYAPVKRALDIAMSLGLLLFLAPVMALIALGIRFSSPGPILYRQTRIGKNGKPFRMLKFRSMQVQNNPDLHREYVQMLIKQNTRPQALGKSSVKLIGDPRITGVGKYLRKFSLDELPQFLNVLKGEMSIVGPRPPLPYEYDVYSEWHKQRLRVSPGITGMWQVKAHNTVAFDDMVRMDIKYIQTMNLWLDLKIMVLTPIEMIRGRGAG
jgi:lipopolysaccharide/colanic/teichoic acid biosynthesis glycosyltransferase